MTKRVDKVLDDGGGLIENDQAVDKSKEQEIADEAKLKNLLVYPLVKSIKAYGDEITIVKMRRPTAKDIVMVGNPVIYTPYADPPRVEHDYQKLIKMIARLSDPPIPSESVADMDPKDLVGLAWAISPFFVPAR